MTGSRLAPVYLFGILLNVVALGYALSTGALLYASAFVLVIVYLTVRYRMLRSN